jgi:ribosomal protein S18 acetylase RimI-like enzyme
MTVDLAVRVRSAAASDQRRISELNQDSAQVHRHLDWRAPLDWVGSRPFLLLEDQRGPAAALACPPDPPAVAWIRLFACLGRIPLQDSWALLWQAARQELVRAGRFVAAAIVLHDWFQELLHRSGFAARQSVVMLERQEAETIRADAPPGIRTRPMMPCDLPAVADVDAAAFEPIWQNSADALRRAFPQAILASVAEREGRVVAYQISTRNPLGAHLARLAVRPEVQGEGIGRLLLADLVQAAAGRGISRLTVNTQSDNAASLALYRKAGFRETGERYPVYHLEIG